MNRQKKALLLATLLAASSSALAAPFSLHSTDFNNGGKLPVAMGGGGSCPGKNVSPQLSWQHVPEKTKSLVLLIDDAQGANGLGVTHFIGYGIDATQTHFAKKALTDNQGYVAGTNSKNVQGFSGPCPPANADIHNYNFTLIATDIAPGDLQKGLTREALMAQLKGHAIGSAGLVGRYIVP